MRGKQKRGRSLEGRAGPDMIPLSYCSAISIPRPSSSLLSPPLRRWKAASAVAMWMFSGPRKEMTKDMAVLEGEAGETKKKEEKGVVAESPPRDPPPTPAPQSPQPPEKPLPGDCCGSGCVRCVWDVYYEELEEYNNLIRSMEQQAADANKSN